MATVAHSSRLLFTRAHQSDERLWAAGLERVVGNRWGTGSGGWWGVRCHSFDYQELMLHTAQSRPAPPRTNPRWVVQFCRQFWIARRRMFANLKEKTKNPRQFFQQCVTSVTSVLYRKCGSGWVGIYFFFFFFFWLDFPARLSIALTLFLRRQHIGLRPYTYSESDSSPHSSPHALPHPFRGWAPINSIYVMSFICRAILLLLLFPPCHPADKGGNARRQEYKELETM